MQRGLKMITKDDIMMGFVNLSRARNEVYESAKAEMEAKHKLRVAEHVALIHGEIDGKNEKQREAQLAFITDAQTLAYQEARDKNARAELDLEQAKDRCRCASMLIELMKLEKEA